MPVARLNLVETQNTYVDALTVEFAYPRPAFSAQVSNAGIYYQVAILGPAGRGADWEPGEHNSAPALLSFADPVEEGFPPGSKFAGIRFRSAATDTPAVITVA